MGMMEKSSQYHKLMTRGADPADRPKGFETKKKNQPIKLGFRDIEKQAVSKRTMETEIHLRDGSTKILVEPLKDYSVMEMEGFHNYVENHFKRVVKDVKDLIALVNNQGQLTHHGK